jgi:hypothetical protein
VRGTPSLVGLTGTFLNVGRYLGGWRRNFAGPVRSAWGPGGRNRHSGASLPEAPTLLATRTERPPTSPATAESNSKFHRVMQLANLSIHTRFSTHPPIRYHQGNSAAQRVQLLQHQNLLQNSRTRIKLTSAHPVPQGGAKEVLA